MKKLLFLFLSFVTILTSTAFAAPEWVEVYPDYYVKPESVEYNIACETVEGWFKILNKGRASDKNIWYAIDYMVFHFDGNRITHRDTHYFNLHKQVYDKNTIPRDETVIPDTELYEVYNVMHRIFEQHKRSEENRSRNNY